MNKNHKTDLWMMAFAWIFSVEGYKVPITQRKKILESLYKDYTKNEIGINLITMGKAIQIKCEINFLKDKSHSS